MELLQSLKFGGDLTLKNKIALAPLTRGRSGKSQVPNDANVEYYKQRSTAGLVITEATIISEQGMGWAGAAAIYKPEHVEGWKKVTKAVHESDGVIFCQLWHMGRTTGSVFHGIQPVAPSAIAAEGRVTDYDGTKYPYEVPRELKLEEIPDVVNQYRIAARNCKEAGFDGIEVHAANGYLLDEFLQSSTNKRTDAYGGSVDNRYRILGEVIEACKESFPSNRIGVRLSPNGAFGSMGSADNFEAFTEILIKLNRLDLAYAHVMDGLGFGFHNLCKQMRLMDVRKVFDGVIIGNVGYTKDTAEGAIRTGAVDMIAFGRPYIANPDLPQRFENDWPLAEADFSTYWSYPNFPDGDPNVGYTDFPVYEEKK
jgi:N-ethylmaleimide reductase